MVLNFGIYDADCWEIIYLWGWYIVNSTITQNFIRHNKRVLSVQQVIVMVTCDQSSKTGYMYYTCWTHYKTIAWKEWLFSHFSTERNFTIVEDISLYYVACYFKLPVAILQ